MKICTDIEQSKKLIELGIDVNTADMMWDDWSLIDEGWKSIVGYYPEIEKDYGRKCYPAWSLVALLEVLNMPALTQNNDDDWDVTIIDPEYPDEYIEVHGPNPVDACVEMIVKLNEKKCHDTRGNQPHI